jgi:surface carbohydrate biosynthesis protein (TIGR04326 family)
LEKLFPKYQGIICSIYTSVSVEAISIGVPVITILDNNELNYSALYDDSSVSFVSTKQELEEALISQYQNGTMNNNFNNYFWTDAELPHWRKLLAID